MIHQQIIDKIKECLKSGKKIAFLVGAGLSAESGIPTFRGKDGYWMLGSKNYTAQEMATKRMFNIAADEVWKWYLYRKSITEFADPNIGHLMLKEIEEILQDQFVLITQNVDGLHRKSGSSEERTYSIHGDLDFVRCGDDCSLSLYPFPKEIELKNRDKTSFTFEEKQILTCPKCGELQRPHVLWFDEFYNEEHYKRDTVIKLCNKTGILFIIGTSGATNLPQTITDIVLSNNEMVVEVNIEKSYFSQLLETHNCGFGIEAKSSSFLSELKKIIQRLD